MSLTLVTGAAGFIGSHVVGELLAEGREVRALLRPGESRENLKGLPIEFVEGDILDRVAVLKCLENVEVVFHLAAIYSIWMKNWKAMYEVNLQGSRNLLWGCLEQGIKKVVYTSSIAAIGIAPGKELSNERTAFNQYTLGSHYVLTKYLSQQEALDFARHGLNLVIVNPAFPFGENDRVPTPTGQLVIDILKGYNRFLFDGGINIVDVRDVARGHVLAAEKGRPGELYILGNANLTMTEFMKLVLRIAGLQGRLTIQLPSSLLKLSTSLLNAWSDYVSNRPPLSTPVEVEYSSNYLYFDNSKAKTELGLEFTPIEDSLARSIHWFRRHGYV